ncbi:uncharacterized protein LOC114333094 [Diabrotica virgifera virgifera]|uniref:Uncharacterized protein LOC114333094 n=1 Tax=Diabrotica virgifera virgifera TaxID=50390 RepID=A0A6P7FVF5_DIAVI|nr:uncharacterized protein LOC114333094 [Diabrotica virgifera virgifera]
MSKIVLLLFTIGAMAVFSAAKQEPTVCYSCTIYDGDLCNDLDLSNRTKVRCPDMPPDNKTTSGVACYTIYRTLYGTTLTERGCTYTEVDGEDVCSHVDNKGYTCDFCYEDLCNDKPIYLN